MKKQVLAVLAIGGALAVQPASAADVCSGLGCTGISLGSYTYVTGASASNVNGATGYNGTVSGVGATFTSSTDNLNIAQVFSPGGISVTSASPSAFDLDQLAFSLAPGYTFTSAYFNLKPDEGSFWPSITDSVTVHFSSGGSETVGLSSSFWGSDNWFGVTTTGSETLTGLTFTGGAGSDGWKSLSSLKLTGITAAVPEPSTWLLMILGFGLVGGVMRRQQRQTARIRFA